MTKLVKSHEWETLKFITKYENQVVVDYMFDYLINESVKYESGSSMYPDIDYALSIARDRYKDQLRSEEDMNQLVKSMDKCDVSGSNMDVVSSDADAMNVDQEIMVSPRTRRNAWLSKFMPIAPLCPETLYTSAMPMASTMPMAPTDLIVPAIRAPAIRKTRKRPRKVVVSNSE